MIHNLWRDGISFVRYFSQEGEQYPHIPKKKTERDWGNHVRRKEAEFRWESFIHSEKRKGGRFFQRKKKEHFGSGWV